MNVDMKSFCLHFNSLEFPTHEVPTMEVLVLSDEPTHCWRLCLQLGLGSFFFDNFLRRSHYILAQSRGTSCFFSEIFLHSSGIFTILSAGYIVWSRFTHLRPYILLHVCLRSSFSNHSRWAKVCKSKRKMSTLPRGE